MSVEQNVFIVLRHRARKAVFWNRFWGGLFWGLLVVMGMMALIGGR